MARLSDLSLRYRLFMKTYRYRSVDWRPGSRLKVPISKARFALVTTAAFHLSSQPGFDPSIKAGDSSYREIPTAVNFQDLRLGHRSDAFDPSGIELDPNLALPIQRFAELADEGEIGSLNDLHISFMGSITAPGRLIKESAPAAARKLLEDGVDAVFLTPV